MTTETSKKPTHIIYSVREGKEKSFWQAIGGVWAHKDGKGFSGKLDCLPLDGKFTVRIASEQQ